jgi:hypothetical protein
VHPLFKNLFDRQQQDVLAVGADEDKQEPDGLKIGRVLHNYSSGSSVFREDRLDGGLEVWKVMLDNGPDDISINAEIPVDEDITHPV